MIHKSLVLALELREEIHKNLGKIEENHMNPEMGLGNHMNWEQLRGSYMNLVQELELENHRN